MLHVHGLALGAPDERAAHIKLLPASRFDERERLMPTLPYGYGHEPETQAFLEALAKLDLKGKRVADIGSGTGILALAAARQGAKVTAFESDDWVMRWLTQHREVNSADIEIRGRFPDDWDGKPFDVALANIGTAAPPLGVAALILVPSVDGTQVEQLDEVGSFERPLLAIEIPTPAPVYPSTLDDARRALMGVPHPLATAEDIADWSRIVHGIHQKAAQVHEAHPEDHEHLARLVARGNEGKIAKHEWLRTVGVAEGVHWADVTVNLVTMTCGCQHYQWFTDSGGDLKIVRHHETTQQCPHHQGEGRAAWKLAHQQSDLHAEITRVYPQTRAHHEPGALVLTPHPASREQVAATTRLMFGNEAYYRLA